MTADVAVAKETGRSEASFWRTHHLRVSQVTLPCGGATCPSPCSEEGSSRSLLSLGLKPREGSLGPF